MIEFASIIIALFIFFLIIPASYRLYIKMLDEWDNMINDMKGKK